MISGRANPRSEIHSARCARSLRSAEARRVHNGRDAARRDHLTHAAALYHKRNHGGSEDLDRRTARRGGEGRGRLASSSRRGSTARRPGTSTRPPRGPMQATWPEVCAAVMTSACTPRRCSARWASGINPSPQTLSRGNRCWSTNTTARPCRASTVAQALPAGPAPTTRTSQCSGRSKRSVGMAYAVAARRSIPAAAAAVTGACCPDSSRRAILGGPRPHPPWLEPAQAAPNCPVPT